MSKGPEEASKGKKEMVEEEKAQGTQWEQEEEGERGEQGQQEEREAQEVQEAQGEQGEQGAQGVQGAQGEQGEQGAQGVQGRDDRVGKPQESQSLFPESLKEEDIWKAIGLDEGFDEDSLEFRPRLISVVSPSLSTTSPPSEVSSPSWIAEEPLKEPPPRTEGSPSASSSSSSHKSSVGLLLPPS